MTWGELIEREMDNWGETQMDMVYSFPAWKKLKETELVPGEPDSVFGGYGEFVQNTGARIAERPPGYDRTRLHFTLWTDSYVYFPVCYDGFLSCGSALRNPCDVASEFVGED